MEDREVTEGVVSPCPGEMAAERRCYDIRLYKPIVLFLFSAGIGGGVHGVSEF